MTTGKLLALSWHWDLSVVLGCEALLLSYLVVLRFPRQRQTLYYTLGVLVLGFALVSPLETLGERYLFSAHMLQHLLLLLVTPPLLLIGMPRALLEKILAVPWIARLERVLRRPPVAWVLGTLTLWVWHLPALYDATLSSEPLHIFEHLTFLVTATIFWYPILAPLAERRLAPLATIPYLFAAAASSSILGIVLTFAPPGLYPAYLNPIDLLGALPFIRNTWGITPAVDQQLAGLLMWVPGSVVYLSGIIAGLARWYGEPEMDEEPESVGLARAVL